MSLRIMHLSDPHFGTVKPEAMAALLMSIKILQPEVVVMSGDITQRARRNQFEEARIFTQTLDGVPLIIAPGNHDVPMFNLFARFFHPYFGFKEILKAKLNENLQLQNVQLLAVNSTRRSRAVQGLVDPKFLKKRLAENSLDSDNESAAATAKDIPKVRVVIFHHHLDCPKRVDEKNLLTNAQQVTEILNQNQVDLVLGGHIHDPHVSLSHNRYPNVQPGLIFSVAGTCLSTRTRSDANNSFNLVDIQSEYEHPKMEITKFFLTSAGHFQATESDRFIRNEKNQWLRN